MDFGIVPESNAEVLVEETPEDDPDPSAPSSDPQDLQPPAIQPPAELLLRSNSQSFDARRNLFIATGDVQATLNGGVLQADRIEFDAEFNTLFARGSVRFRRGAQYFPASTLRLSLIQGSGEMEDVYGVLDLDNLLGLARARLVWHVHGHDKQSYIWTLAMQLLKPIVQAIMDANAYAALNPLATKPCFS